MTSSCEPDLSQTVVAVSICYQNTHLQALVPADPSFPFPPEAPHTSPTSSGSLQQLPLLGPNAIQVSEDVLTAAVSRDLA